MNVRWAKQQQEIDQVSQHDPLGFESIQLPVDAVMKGEESDFLREKEILLSKGVSFEVFESPLPAGIQVTEQGFNMYSWTEYLHTAIRRIAELGCKVLVWNDGKTRILPFEGEKSSSREQFQQFVFLLCDISKQYNITVCLEPLSERRTNYLNSLEEATKCFTAIGSSNLSLTIGLRSLVELSINFTDLLSYKDAIAHIHVENPINALEMKSPCSTDGYDYAPFFSALRELQFSGVLSLPPDANGATLQYCKEFLE
jgi:sugar phosphate isomerase/epimerase